MPKNSDQGFRFLEHTADVQVECWGLSLEEAFEQAVLGLEATITPDLDKVARKTEKIVTMEAEDMEALLFDFLSELLYLFDVEDLVFSEIKITHITATSGGQEIEAHLRGEEFDRDKHEIGTEVKAITYSYMEISQVEGKFKIKVVFDI